MPKTVLIKAIDPCSIEICKKDFDGIKVEALRQAFDYCDGIGNLGTQQRLSHSTDCNR
ncbi:MAG: hypothetical protein VX915_02340 [Pseudomonadota bacterium]|nr:hypothetical protein [Pseudomonadota bacterium]